MAICGVYSPAKSLIQVKDIKQNFYESERLLYRRLAIQISMCRLTIRIFQREFRGRKGSSKKEGKWAETPPEGLSVCFCLAGPGVGPGRKANIQIDHKAVLFR